jgi:hypothetical protein
MRKKFIISALCFCLVLTSAACVLTSNLQADNNEEESQIIDDAETEPSDELYPEIESPEVGSGVISAGALDPEMLTYLGAFRLPDDSGGLGWDYSGHGMTFYPDGDPGGGADGFSGSLFIVGHDQQLDVAEVTIPEPAISKNLDDLNTAETLQPFSDISGGYITDALAIPRMGIEYLPVMGEQTSGMLYFTIGQHIQAFEASHGWASLDLSDPNPAGLWVFDGYTNYATNDYLFEIPEDWANTYVYGYRLGSGRFREGVWSGLGPALFAFAPWEDGNPPGEGSTLTSIIPLLLYGEQVEGEPEIITSEDMQMDGYAESDHWWGGAWLTSGAGDAVIFVGTKAIGENWYGFANGVVWDYACADDPDIDCPEVPDYPYDNRGFWAEDFLPMILFFDPADLALVAQGLAEPYEPQPYALMDLTDYWIDPETNVEIYKRDLAGAAAFDREHGILFIIERLADEYKSVIHVFQIEE